jgi:hypothetical protein
MNFPLLLRSVNFQPANAFNALDLNTMAPIPSSSSVSIKGEGCGDAVTGDNTAAEGGRLGEMLRKESMSRKYLKSGGIKQFVFQISPKDKDDRAAAVASELGTIRIHYTGNCGESGSIISAPVVRSLPPREVRKKLKLYFEYSVVLFHSKKIHCDLLLRLAGFFCER